MYILTEKVPIEWKSFHWKIKTSNKKTTIRYPNTNERTKKIKSHIYNENSNVLGIEFLKNKTNLLIKELNFCYWV